MSPSKALHLALDEIEGGYEEFATLSGKARKLMETVVLICGRDQLLIGNGAAEQAAFVVRLCTRSGRMGEAAALATCKWAGRSE